MSQTKQNKGWPVIGSLRQSESEDPATGKKVKSSYLKMADGVEIFLDGKKVELNKTRTVKLECPRKKVEGLCERGHITEKQRDERLEKLSEMEWLRYDLVAPPPRD